MASVPILSQLNDIKTSLTVWAEIIQILKEKFSAFTKNKVLEQALVKLAKESNELDDAEKDALKIMIEYCRQSSVAERKAEIGVGTIHSIVQTTLRALNHSTENGRIFEGFLKKIESKLSELTDAIDEIGKLKDSFLCVKIALQRIRNRWDDSKRNQLSNDAALLNGEGNRQMASLFPAIAGVIAMVPHVIGPVAGTSATVGLIIVKVANYVEGCGTDEYRKLIDKIKKVEQFFEEIQNCLEKCHKATTEKLSLLLEIKKRTDVTVFGSQDVLEGIGSYDDVKEDLERLKRLCEEYKELSSSLIRRNLVKLDQRKISQIKQEMSKRKRED